MLSDKIVAKFRYFSVGHKSRNHTEELDRRGKSEEKNLSGTRRQILGVETYL